MQVLTVVIDELHRRVDIRADPRPDATPMEIHLGKSLENLLKAQMVKAIQATWPPDIKRS